MHLLHCQIVCACELNENMEMNKPIDKIENQNDSEKSNQLGVITTSEFLDFLKLACNVHESIILKDENATALDYNALVKNELVNSLANLKSDQSPKTNGAEESCGNEKNGKYLSRRSENQNNQNMLMFSDNVKLSTS